MKINEKQFLQHQKFNEIEQGLFLLSLGCWYLRKTKQIVEVKVQHQSLPNSGSDLAWASGCETNLGRLAGVFMLGFILKWRCLMGLPEGQLGGLSGECSVCIGRCSVKGRLVCNVDLMLRSNPAILTCFLRPLTPLLHVESGDLPLYFMERRAVIRQDAPSSTHLTSFPFYALASLLVWGKDLILIKSCPIVPLMSCPIVPLWVPPQLPFS